MSKTKKLPAGVPIYEEGERMSKTFDLKSIDPKTLPPSPETDAMVAEWMGWTSKTRMVRFADFSDGQEHPKRYWISPNGCEYSAPPPYSTNFAHAVEAMLEVDDWMLTTGKREGDQGFRVTIRGGENIFEHEAWMSETDSDKGKTIALAICRAIAAAMKAKGG